jgi:hypothetical protein
MKPSSKPPKTCTAEGCDRKHLAQGLCRNHYNVARKRDSLPGVDHSGEHWLSDISAEDRTGHCSICGPVERIWRKTSGGFRCPIKARRDAAESRKRPEVRAYHAEYNKTRVKHRRLAKYNLTESDLDALIQACGSACSICQKPLSTFAEMNIDHDHSCCPGRNSCGKCVRGILCMPCNQGLGFFRDSQDRLSDAIEYLKRTS